MTIIDMSNDYVGEIMTTYKITGEMVDNILCTAFEGGINYWCSYVEPRHNVWPEGAGCASECLSRGCDLSIFDSEEEDDNGNPVEYVLTLSAFIHGVEKAAIWASMSVNDFYENHDASDADNVIQFALFGKLVYG